MQLVIILRRGLDKLVAPRLASEDERRHEFILNVMLLGMLALSVTALIQVFQGMVRDGAAFGGASPLIPLAVILFLLGLYRLSRRGHVRIAAYIFIGCMTAIAVGVCVAWGIGLPAAALLFVLVIVMSGTLIGTRFSILMLAVCSFLIVVLGYLESRQIVEPNLFWAEKSAGLNDSFGYMFIWGVIALVMWLSNREIERSLARARASEADLARQRDLLEERVEERTRELKQAQLEKILQLNRFADFGRISSGFFHDILNPLTAVSLNLEQLSTKKRSELLQQAIAGVRHIEDFAVAARKQVQGHSELKVFSPAEEIRQVVAILNNKARTGRVKVVCELDDAARLYGNAIKFHQMVSNLVANAIDAYEDSQEGARLVKVKLESQAKQLKLTVTDRGVGILPEHLELIFDPFFTTKPVEKGTGIGLLIAKRVVEEDFYGSIKVVSTAARGTVFTVVLPAAS